jgi:hypothetical protein
MSSNRNVRKFVFFILSFFSLETNAHLSDQKEAHFQYSTISESDFPNISNLIYIKHLTGGTGGVHIFEDPKNNKLWTLKSWTSYGHGINEILASLLLSHMGVETPQFFAQNTLPDAIKNQCNLQGHLFRFSEYVEGNQPSYQELERLLPSYFVPLSFISFWDIKPDNFILNKQGKLVLVDTGGALLYRSLGTPKNEGQDWSKYQITDFQTLRNPNLSNVADIFKKITENDLNLQISTLLPQLDKLHVLADDFCRQFHYRDRKKVLSMMAARLQHAHLLQQVSRGILNANNDVFAAASSYDAAGTLTYTWKEGKPYLLIGKRVGHQWWGNLGGKADPEELLLKTAIRETQEESSSQLKFSERDLLLSASHDLINIHKEGTFTRFRTYLTETKNPACIQDMHDEEYTQYAFIEVKDVLEALKTNKIIREENQETICVQGHILHPPFFWSLRQNAIRGWLETLLRPDFDKNMLREKHTQSILNKPDLQEVKEEYITHPTFKNLEYAFLVAEKVKRTPLQRAVRKNNFDVNPCASDYLLNQLKNINGVNPEATLEESLKILYPELNLSEKNIHLVQTILDEERQHSDKFVMYHATQSIIWFNYRILSILRHLLNETPVQTDVLRSMDTFFDTFKNAKDLLNFVMNPDNNNYSTGFKSCGISCNPMLFSNWRHDTSSTFNYFFEGVSRCPPSDPFNIIWQTFSELGIDANSIIQEFKAIYEKKITSNDKGALLQFFIDSSIATDACYISASLGKPAYDGNHKLIAHPAPVLELLKQGKTIEGSRDSRLLQTRLHANLSKFPEGLVIVKDYLSGGGYVSTIDDCIKQVLKKYLFNICKNLPKNEAVYHVSPQIQALLRDAEELPEDERQAPETPIVKAYKSRDLITIRTLLENNPSLIHEEVVNYDTLASISLSSTYVSSLMDPTLSMRAIQLSQSMIKPTMSNKDVKTILEFVTMLEKNIEDIDPIIALANPISESLLKAFYHYDSINYDSNIANQEKSIDTIIDIIKQIPIERLIDLIESAKILIRSDMQPDVIYDIIIYISQLNKDQQKTLIGMDSLIRPDMDFSWIKEIIELISEVNLESKKHIIKAIKYLTINPHMRGYDCLKIIRNIVSLPMNQIKTIAKCSKILIQSDMNDVDTDNIIQAIFLLNPENAISIAKSIQKHLLSKSDIKIVIINEILESVIYVEEPETLIVAAAILIRPEFGFYDIRCITKALSKINTANRISVAHEVKKHLMNIPNLQISIIIQILESVISNEEPETLIEAAAILLRPDFDLYDIERITKALSKINSTHRISVSDTIKTHLMNIPNLPISIIIQILESVISAEEPETLIEATAILLRPDIDLFEIQSITKALSKINSTHRTSVTHQIKIHLINNHDISDYYIITDIIKFLASVNQPESVIESLGMVIQPNMSCEDIIPLIKAISKINPENRSSFIKLFISNININFDYINTLSVSIIIQELNTTDQPQSIMEAAKILIQPEMTEWDIMNIIKAISKIKQGDRFFIIELIKPLIQNTMNSHNICQLMEIADSADHPESAIKAAMLLIRPGMNMLDVKSIIEPISKINYNERMSIINKANKLTKENMSSLDIVKIIQAVISNNPDETIIEAVGVFIQSGMKQNNILIAIEEISKIKSDYRMPVASAIAKHLMIMNMTGYTLRNVIQKAASKPLDRLDSLMEKLKEGQSN